ncbi:hypothetical protein AMAG_13594 [Allomyces macrogynus ATCC 38327]|uniref:Uncharacterized protein n=1 Tax=Allomyces macrogynus (strain ATCC 38327) TaxID=578462 RepID=A0A0L0T3A3_ALLM3|nr:hypothetical protein AMAG_13594 [Allomyces macrogynus ATCC 38327]|eukprot:KNE69202.1 hypothetical protein AMAG_13594 [Allomyces macrogynus ATCC 38327]
MGFASGRTAAAAGSDVKYHAVPGAGISAAGEDPDPSAACMVDMSNEKLAHVGGGGGGAYDSHPGTAWAASRYRRDSRDVLDARRGRRALPWYYDGCFLSKLVIAVVISLWIVAVMWIALTFDPSPPPRASPDA